MFKSAIGHGRFDSRLHEKYAAPKPENVKMRFFLLLVKIA
jgi:hypothetical protein